MEVVTGESPVEGRVVCEVGPDCGVSAPLSGGPVVVGRSPSADLTVHDPTIELHHLVVEPLADGRIRVTQISGRTITRIGGQPLTSGTTVIPTGTVIDVGASRLRVGTSAVVASDTASANTPIAATAPPGGPRLARRRRRTPAVGASFDDIDPLTGELEPPFDPASAVPNVAELLASRAAVVQRAEDDGTMFRVHLGVIDDGGDHSRGVETDLEPGAIVQLLGPGASGVARSVVVQLAAQVPADRLKLVVVGATGWLPDGVQLAHLGPADAAEHVVVIAADTSLATLESTALRARLGVGSAAAIVLLDDRVVAPNLAVPGGRLRLGALGRGRWSPGPDVMRAKPIHAAGVEPATVVRFASGFGSPPPSGGGSVGDAYSPAVERVAVGNAISTIDVVGTWRASTRPALWLGRDGPGHRWVQLTAGAIAVIGDDESTRRAALATYAAALVLEHDPARLDVVLGTGLATPGSVHGTSSPLRPGRLVHELARPRPRSDRSDVLVVDADAAHDAGDEFGPGPLELLADACRSDVHAVLGLRLDHPWCGSLMAEPSTTVVVTGVASIAAARSLIGDSRASRLAPGQVLVRTSGEVSPRLLRVPLLGPDAMRRIEGVVTHAAALVGAAVRSCGPCPDDDSWWAPPSSDPSNEAIPVGASSGECLRS